MNWPHLANNPLFSGGLALGAVASAFALARRYLTLILRRFVVDVEVREWDMVMWLGLWLAHTHYGKRCRKLQTCVLREGGEDAALFFEPGLGPHLFRYEGAWVLVDRKVDKEDNVWSRREFYSIRVLGAREAATSLIESAKEYGVEILQRRNTAYISDGKGEWKQIAVGAPRPLATVILPGTLAADLVTDVRTFLDRRTWYVERGIPWRRGYLFKGPPRTGKTSAIRALCSEIGMPMYVLDLSGSEFTDRDLVITLARVPARAAVVIEDIDAIGALARDRGEAESASSTSKITLSGLLNALDGPLTAEGRVLFVTTNHPERLDPALLGEGRLDVHVTLGCATRDQIERMFLRFFPSERIAAEAFADAVPHGKLPPAAIQEYLLVRSEDVTRAAEEAHLLAAKVGDGIGRMPLVAA